MKEFTPPGPGPWELETTHFAGAMSRYGQSMFISGIKRGFGEGGERYGTMLEELRLRFVNDFAYAQRVIVGLPAEPAPKPPPTWLVWLMFRLHPALRRRNKNALNALKHKYWEQDLKEWDSFYRDDSIRRNLELVDVDLAALSDEELVAHLNATRDNMEEMFYRHHKWSVPAIYPTGGFLAIVTRSGTIKPAEAIAALKGSTPVSTGAFTEQQKELREAAKAAGISVGDVDEIPDGGNFLDEVRKLSPDIVAPLDNYVRHVSQALVSGYGVHEKTVLETPNILKRRIASAIAGPKPVEDDGDEFVEGLRSRLSGDELAEFDTWLGHARNINRLRDERGVYNDIWAAGISRLALLEVGQRLVASGTLSDPELVVEATHEEVLDLFAGKTLELAEELKERQRWRLSSRIDDVPQWIGIEPPSDPPPFDLMPRGIKFSMEGFITAFGQLDDEEPAPEPVTTEESTTLTGIAVSPGTYEGTARVIKGPEDFARLEPGDVLVTKNTSAAFNVVLPILGALVTDRGGLLSHAAIVSREYGIPGVVATKTATSTIEDGATVIVDGDAGTVSVRL